MDQNSNKYRKYRKYRKKKLLCCLNKEKHLLLSALIGRGKQLIYKYFCSLRLWMICKVLRICDVPDTDTGFSKY